MWLQITWHMHSTVETVTATPNFRIFQTIVDSPSDLEMGIHSPLHIKNYNNALKEATLI